MRPVRRLTRQRPTKASLPAAGARTMDAGQPQSGVSESAMTAPPTRPAAALLGPGARRAAQSRTLTVMHRDQWPPVVTQGVHGAWRGGGMVSILAGRLRSREQVGRAGVQAAVLSALPRRAVTGCVSAAHVRQTSAAQSSALPPSPPSLPSAQTSGGQRSRRSARLGLEPRPPTRKKTQ